ncbi:class F sortase [uncultured Phycicoccus sp.]|uniref:class F sortase n=1 Tax=uncultured Phycicoccus sp. TaxID=661422 RepID=UPI002624434C|nr:class F sortase [uncultured Phycicoccus sp.]
MTPTTAARRWQLGSAAAGCVALLAVLGLAGWALGRPEPSAGKGLAALSAPAADPPTPSAAADPGPAPTPSVRATARDASPAAASSEVAPAPTRLRIPDLDVDARVRPVGVEPDGAMVIPAAPTSVGWYRFGPAPADPEGNTVIAGHVATREDGPGALAALANAEVGMRVEVVDADGTKHRYEVTGREAVRKRALPVETIFARNGRPLLVLITCGGEYIPELRSHEDNVVVTATPVG